MDKPTRPEQTSLDELLGNPQQTSRALEVVMLHSFVQRIKQMNLAFQPITCYNSVLTDLGPQRIDQFHSIMINELKELIEAKASSPEGGTDFAQLADCLGDLVVYIFSEAARWGVPLLEVLSAIMDSQESKLVDGKPIPHPTEPGKFGKGPNFQPPENAIRLLLEKHRG